MIKGLLNLIVLIALCVGGFYLYVTITEDYELIAQIKNTQDRLLVQMQQFIDELKQDIEDMKREADDAKRSFGA